MAAVLRDFADQSDGIPIFVPSPGNWGDALINEGSRQFFRTNGIEVDEIRRDALQARLGRAGGLSGRAVIVGGGGGWCKNFSTTPEFVEMLRPHVRRIAVLPTTYELPFLTGVGAPVHYFSRQHDNRPEQIDFCHDMAFYVDADVDVSTNDRLWRLFAMRLDKERNAEAITPVRNVDFSALGNSYSSTHQFFELVGRFDDVYTDRLHVAIAASLLDRRVFLLPGNYRKSLAVYEASIKDNYPNTRPLTWTALAERLAP